MAERSGNRATTVAPGNNLTTPDAPQLNGVVERGLSIVQEAAQPACLEAPRLFTDVQTPATASLWAGACLWANAALKRSVTEANPGRPMTR